MSDFVLLGCVIIRACIGASAASLDVRLILPLVANVVVARLGRRVRLLRMNELARTDTTRRQGRTVSGDGWESVCGGEQTAASEVVMYLLRSIEALTLGSLMSFIAMGSGDVWAVSTAGNGSPALIVGHATGRTQSTHVSADESDPMLTPMPLLGAALHWLTQC